LTCIAQIRGDALNDNGETCLPNALLLALPTSAFPQTNKDISFPTCTPFIAHTRHSNLAMRWHTLTPDRSNSLWPYNCAVALQLLSSTGQMIRVSQWISIAGTSGLEIRQASNVLVDVVTVKKTSLTDSSWREFTCRPQGSVCVEVLVCWTRKDVTKQCIPFVVVRSQTDEGKLLTRDYMTMTS